MRDLEEPNTPSHISYKEYQKKVTNSPNANLVLFVSAFFVMLLLFLGIARQLSPEVDVAIGDDTTQEEIAKRSVDDRLKLIQMEDNSAETAVLEDKDKTVKDETLSPELEERVKVPKNEHSDQNLADEEIILHPQTTPVQNVQIAKPQAVPTPAVNAKVVVGYYATPQQAEVAKGILLDSGINANPFIKNLGGAYTLQIGSFNSREKAQSVANELLRNNFPARVIVE